MNTYPLLFDTAPKLPPTPQRAHKKGDTAFGATFHTAMKHDNDPIRRAMYIESKEGVQAAAVSLDLTVPDFLQLKAICIQRGYPAAMAFLATHQTLPQERLSKGTFA